MLYAKTLGNIHPLRIGAALWAVQPRHDCHNYNVKNKLCGNKTKPTCSGIVFWIFIQSSDGRHINQIIDTSFIGSGVFAQIRLKPFRTVDSRVFCSAYFRAWFRISVAVYLVFSKWRLNVFSVQLRNPFADTLWSYIYPRLCNQTNFFVNLPIAKLISERYMGMK